jgi:hypothetical protein
MNILLLNSTFEVIDFISDRKAIKLLYKEKVDIIAEWDEEIRFGEDIIKFPSILRMKYQVKRNYSKFICSRLNIFKRDGFRCQYCNIGLNHKTATIDHIIPKSMGGILSYLNCITACFDCNNQKGNRKLDDTNLKLIRDPFIPTRYIHSLPSDEKWHDEWNTYLR